MAARVIACLQAMGHQVVDMSQWSWGASFVAEMQRLDGCDRMLALWSTHYFASNMCMAELEAAFRRDRG